MMLDSVKGESRKRQRKTLWPSRMHGSGRYWKKISNISQNTQTILRDWHIWAHKKQLMAVCSGPISQEGVTRAFRYERSRRCYARSKYADRSRKGCAQASCFPIAKPIESIEIKHWPWYHRLVSPWSSYREISHQEIFSRRVEMPPPKNEEYGAPASWNWRAVTDRSTGRDGVDIIYCYLI